MRRRTADCRHWILPVALAVLTSLLAADVSHAQRDRDERPETWGQPPTPPPGEATANYAQYGAVALIFIVVLAAVTMPSKRGHQD